MWKASVLCVLLQPPFPRAEGFSLDDLLHPFVHIFALGKAFARMSVLCAREVYSVSFIGIDRHAQDVMASSVFSYGIDIVEFSNWFNYLDHVEFRSEGDFVNKEGSSYIRYSDERFRAQIAIEGDVTFQHTDKYGPKPSDGSVAWEVRQERFSFGSIRNLLDEQGKGTEHRFSRVAFFLVHDDNAQWAVSFNAIEISPDKAVLLEGVEQRLDKTNNAVKKLPSFRSLAIGLVSFPMCFLANGIAVPRHGLAVTLSGWKTFAGAAPLCSCFWHCTQALGFCGEVALGKYVSHLISPKSSDSSPKSNMVMVCPSHASCSIAIISLSAMLSGCWREVALQIQNLIQSLWNPSWFMRIQVQGSGEQTFNALIFKHQRRATFWKQVVMIMKSKFQTMLWISSRNIDCGLKRVVNASLYVVTIDGMTL